MLGGYFETSSTSCTPTLNLLILSSVMDGYRKIHTLVFPQINRFL